MTPVRTIFGKAAFLLFIAAQVFAGTTGKIAGTVIDGQTKEAVVGANIVIVGTTMGASSDVDGQYFILNIPPGTYDLRASAVGYSPVVVNKVSVSVDQTTRIQFTLEPQSVQLGEVVVNARRPIVQKDLTSTVANVTSEQLSKLPLEDVSAAVNLQAGVVDGHFRGGRGNEVKYLIDGVSVNDAFTGTASMEAEINSVAEVQVLSGTFNAEYGEALSGVVNEVTKIASDAYTGDFSAYTGNYLSNRTSLFPNIDHISPKNLQNFQGSLSGPVGPFGSRLKFFLSGRYLKDDGYIYGQRIFTPKDSSNFSANDPSQWLIQETGDKAWVPMNNTERATLQGKLAVNVGSVKDVILSGMYQQENYRVYDHAFRLNPDGDYTYHQKSYLASASYTHVFNDAAFMDVSGSFFLTDYRQYVYPDPLDPRYANPDLMQVIGPNAFLTGGTQNWYFKHITSTTTGRLNFTAQVTPVHQIKAGAEVDFHHLHYTDFQIHVDPYSNFVPGLTPPGSFDNNEYRTNPYQIAGYVQDKIELEYLVVNVGLRFDYFQADGAYLNNPDNIAALDTLAPPYPAQFFTRAMAKYQFSPRLGVSYPISDKGALHFSYGHFFQVPPFEFLYRNPNYRIALTGTYPDFIGNIIGNPNLQPQRTTMYEIGLQQELTPELGVTVTGYYKDIRNLLGVQIHIKNNIKKFAEYINRDYGAVRGMTVSFEKRFSGGIGATLDYTYQVAKGDASDPNEDYNKSQATPPIESNKELVPLDWDRRHSLNVTLTLGTPGDFVVSAVGRAGSGLPYTPSSQDQRTGVENSDNRPAFYNVDLYATKYFRISGNTTISIFAKAYNVFDIANEVDIFTDTGRAGYTLALTQESPLIRGVNTLQQYFTRPDFYSAPRQVIVGAAFSF